MIKVISAFPGTGKTYAFKNSGYICLDSDSSLFSKTDRGERNPEFPSNYIEHIKTNLGRDDIDFIFVSSHKEVRDALIEAGISFVLIYPDKSLKEEYLNRYRIRNSPKSFIDLLDKMWNEWIDSCINQEDVTQIVLFSGKYVEDALESEIFNSDLK